MTLRQRIWRSLGNAMALSSGFLFGWCVLLPICLNYGIVGIIFTVR